ncbi:hypothetical protein BDV28DRAFT_136476 [Aspergillus coremiiformis]|uniref:J domain-containing protein n=1 Tax=Aspergillus coremiiformis TaxID=138285 RepID=A0A5N6Z238_9EURO|nr:hypothetical protein BDV28DRAFT_136476 [Aspergillus coremiiformis]
MLKKPHVLYYGGLQLLNPPPSYYPRPCPHRCYATVHNFHQDDLSWPSTSSFTPYDVFKQDRNAPYSKARFYELVKIYHPDRPCNGHPLCRDISPEVRVQRYHIVVAAHEILSDSSRRAAYDLSGVGWNPHPQGSQHPPWARPGSSDWSPVYANATWEDWERWHNRYKGKQQNMVDHRTFTRLVILLTLLGGALQASWINRLSIGYDDRIQQLNEETMRLLAGRRENTTQQMASSEAKVQHFLVRRDPSGVGLKEEEQQVYQKALYPQQPVFSEPTRPDKMQGNTTIQATERDYTS